MEGSSVGVSDAEGVAVAEEVSEGVADVEGASDTEEGIGSDVGPEEVCDSLSMTVEDPGACGSDAVGDCDSDAVGVCDADSLGVCDSDSVAVGSGSGCELVGGTGTTTRAPMWIARASLGETLAVNDPSETTTLHNQRVSTQDSMVKNLKDD